MKVDVSELKAWARSRIDHCRREEEKFSPSSDACLAAATERRALRAVLNLIAAAEEDERKARRGS